ncbi:MULTISPECIES: formimidoylglutamase [Rossellomorea]|jgi:formiminoglutamase|uniref:formimidoylglutamase n=1 Tax=Rossellomorea TaxID=2837508 RepID=UPI0011E8E698|nr:MULTISPECIES: formimidoylglutamase [Rossellomorea]MDT9026794.1 formimidoylglutamase [Rossellomorea sp. YC4-1]TYS85225.1 formimidoylglutamase [Rossellomorea aquimaris]
MSTFQHIKQAGKAQFKDRYTTKAAELLTPWVEGIKGDIAIIGAPLSKPSISHSGASFAPDAIRRCLNSFTTYNIERGTDLAKDKKTIIDFGDITMHPTSIEDCHQRIYESVKDATNTNAAPFTIILGGDHSITTSTVKAIKETKGTVGIIQFDAHHDLRNTEDGGPTNGTPFRRLIEEGHIKGEHLIQIGIRNYANAKAYYDYAIEQGVTVYTMKDVRQQPMTELINNALNQLQDKVDTIYLSVDMDVLDQAYAPGCPAIGPGGMHPDTLTQAIETALQHPKVHTMDIVEIDPTLDTRDMTSRVASLLIINSLL